MNNLSENFTQRRKERRFIFAPLRDPFATLTGKPFVDRLLPVG
jgi:hypothetical protein